MLARIPEIGNLEYADYINGENMKIKRHNTTAARALCAIAAFAFYAAASSPAFAGTAATLQYVKGKVDTRPNDKAPWTSAKKGASISEGAWIRTGGESEAVLRWQQGHVVKFTAFTTLKIAKMSMDAAANTESNQLDVSVGKILVKSHKLMSNNSTFTVKTPTAVAGVRGTDFAVEVAEDGASKVTLLSGQLDIVGDVVDTLLQSNMQIEIPSASAASTETPEPAPIPEDARQQLEQDFKGMESLAPESALPDSAKPDEKANGKGSVEDNVLTITDQVLSNPAANSVSGAELDLPPMPPER